MKNLFILLATLALAGANDAQVINTVAGGGFSGLGDGGPATSAELYNPHGVEIDAAGNIYIADGNNSRVRKVTNSTGIITTLAGLGTRDYNGDSIPATTAALDSPWDLALDAAGNIYIADSYNNRIRKIDISTGLISSIAGIAVTSTLGPVPNGGYNGDNIPANTAKLYHPNGIAIDGAGNIFIADYYNNRVRKITAGTGMITTIAGTGSNAYNGDGIPATTAAVFGPDGVAIDASGNVYISEGSGYRVRKVTASTGLISTIAGNGSYGYSGDGGPATQAQIGAPISIVTDASGNVFIGSNGCRIRKINALTGIITTFAGDGNVGFTGDGGPALNAQFNNPSGLGIDAAGNIYVGDAINNRVRKINSGNLTDIPRDYSNGDITLSPNPFNREALLSFPEPQLNSDLRIRDAQGKEVYHENFTGKTFIIEKGELSEGIYFISVKTNDGTVTSRKFVIQ